MCYRNTSLTYGGPGGIRTPDRAVMSSEPYRLATGPYVVGMPGFDPGQEHPSGAKSFINASRVQRPPPNLIIIYNNIILSIKQERNGGPDRTRTRCLLNANQTLYPVELLALTLLIMYSRYGYG